MGGNKWSYFNLLATCIRWQSHSSLQNLECGLGQDKVQRCLKFMSQYLSSRKNSCRGVHVANFVDNGRLGIGGHGKTIFEDSSKN